MDIGDTIAPTSDQLDAVDLLAGERIFTIAKVSKGEVEQPVNIHLAEFPRPWRPGKSMRRVLVACWGPDAAKYVGRRVALFCDPSVRFGGEEVGGTRIRALSHLDKPRTIPLLVTRGRSAPYRVQPLPDDAPTVPSVTAETLAEMRNLFVRKGIAPEQQLVGVNLITGGGATAIEVITEQDARRVIASLRQRPDVAAESRAAEDGIDHDPTTDPEWNPGGEG